MTELVQKLLDAASTTEGIIALCVLLAISMLSKNPSVAPLLKGLLEKLSPTPKPPEPPKTQEATKTTVVTPMWTIESTGPDLIGPYSELIRAAVDAGDTEQIEALNKYIQRLAKLKSATQEA